MEDKIQKEGEKIENLKENKENMEIGNVVCCGFLVQAVTSLYRSLCGNQNYFTSSHSWQH